MIPITLVVVKVTGIKPLGEVSVSLESLRISPEIVDFQTLVSSVQASALPWL